MRSGNIGGAVAVTDPLIAGKAQRSAKCLKNGVPPPSTTGCTSRLVFVG